MFVSVPVSNRERRLIWARKLIIKLLNLIVWPSFRMRSRKSYSETLYGTVVAVGTWIVFKRLDANRTVSSDSRDPTKTFELCVFCATRADGDNINNNKRWKSPFLRRLARSFVQFRLAVPTLKEFFHPRLRSCGYW